MNHPTGLICIVSAQIWPNLLGLLHLYPEVDVLCLYHSSHEGVSQGPARRFRDWCGRQFPDLEVRLSGDEGHVGTSPEEVAAMVQSWIEARPDWNWIVNLTGGTKLMTCGLSDLIGAPIVGERARFVYREINGENYWLTRDSAGRIVSQSFETAPDLADDLDIELLAELQQGDKWLPQRARTLPILAMVAAGLRHRWNWSNVFDDCEIKVGEDRGNGRLFEEFVAAALLQMGVRQVAINLKTGAKDQHESEVDVVCLHHNQLHLFDCKLPTSQQLGKQKNAVMVTEINDTANRLRDMGGVGGKGYLLRPSRDYNGPQKKLAQRFQLEIWDRPVMTRFFDKLGEILEISPLQWTEELRQANAYLHDHVASDGEAFCCCESFLTERTEPGDFPNLQRALGDWAKENGHADWTGHVDASGALILSLHFADRANRETREQQLQELFSDWSNKGTHYEINSTEAVVTLPGLEKKQRRALYKKLSSGALSEID